MSLSQVETKVTGEIICITCVFRKDCNLSHMLFILEGDLLEESTQVSNLKKML